MRVRLATCSHPPRAARPRGVGEGLFWRAGGSCSPRTPSLPVVSSFSPLGTSKHQVLQSWGMGMWRCHGLGTRRPRGGVTRASRMAKVPRVPHPELLQDPPGAAAPTSRRNRDVQGLSPRHRSGGASTPPQRSARSRRMGRKAIFMANRCWEHGLLTICPV